jgi:hypothetical protein
MVMQGSVTEDVLIDAFLMAHQAGVSLKEKRRY